MKKLLTFVLFNILILYTANLYALNIFKNQAFYFDVNGELNLELKTYLPYTDAYPLAKVNAYVYGKTFDDKIKPYKKSTEFLPTFDFALGIKGGFFLQEDLELYSNLEIKFNAINVFDEHKSILNLNKFGFGLQGDKIFGTLLLGTKKDAINTFVEPMFDLGTGFKLQSKTFGLSYHFVYQDIEFLLAGYLPMPFLTEVYKNTDQIKKVDSAAYSIGYKQTIPLVENHSLKLALGFSSFNKDYNFKNQLDKLQKKPQRNAAWENEFAGGIAYSYDIYTAGFAYTFEFQPAVYDTKRLMGIRKPNKQSFGLHFDVKPIAGLKVYANLIFRMQEAPNILQYWYEIIQGFDPSTAKHNFETEYVAFEAKNGKWQKLVATPKGNKYSFDYFAGLTYNLYEDLELNFELGASSTLATAPVTKKGTRDDLEREYLIYLHQVAPNDTLIKTGKKFEKNTGFTKFYIDFGFTYKF